jgi:16S rRNA processing protein RimM
VGGAIAIALIRRPHGLKGEVVVTDFTEGIFAPGPGLAVVLLGPTCQVATTVESWRPKGDGWLAKLAGIDDRAAAEVYRDWRVAVAVEALPAAPEGVYYEFELVGLPVETTTGETAGAVVAVYSAGPHDVLVIEAGERTYDVPLVRAHVSEVRRGEKIVVVTHREG